MKAETHQTYSHCPPSGVARSFRACPPACLSYRQPFGFQRFRMSITSWYRGSSLIPMAKFGILSLTTKKNFKKYLISLIIKHLQRGIFAVKRFNSRVTGFGVVWGAPVVVATSAPTHARAYARMHAGTHHHRIFIKTFCFLLSASGRYLCSPGNPGSKNKTI